MLESQKIRRPGVLALLALAPCTLCAQSDTSEEIKALRQMIANLQSQIDELKAQRGTPSGEGSQEGLRENVNREPC